MELFGIDEPKNTVDRVVRDILFREVVDEFGKLRTMLPPVDRGAHRTGETGKGGEQYHRQNGLQGVRHLLSVQTGIDDGLERFLNFSYNLRLDHGRWFGTPRLTGGGRLG